MSRRITDTSAYPPAVRDWLLALLIHAEGPSCDLTRAICLLARRRESMEL